MNIQRIQDEFGLNLRQSKFVINMIELDGNQTKSYEMAGYESETPHIHANQLVNNSKVASAYRSILDQEYGNTEFKVDQGMIVEDLQALKLKAMESINTGKAAGGTWNGFVRACELQGKAIGMFITKHHVHEHQHALVPTEELVKRLQRSNPELATKLGKHLNVIDGELSTGDNVSDATLPKPA